ncbi:hypothetical protein PybrP1_005566, partial [[Pythium] brassicae (nom. inval.)]
PEELEAADGFEAIETPGDRAASEMKSRMSKHSIISVADAERTSINAEAERREYTGANIPKYLALRIVTIIILVVIGIALRDNFGDLQDFIGASAVTLCCIILPIVFYLKLKWTSTPLYEKAFGIIVVIACAVLGCYVTYNSGKNLFDEEATDPEILFPFCYPEHERAIYYIKST